MLEPLKNLIEEADSMNQFRCGNNYFLDDVWDFHGYFHTTKTSKYYFRLDFSVWNSLPKMKETIKRCMVESLNLDAWATVVSKLSGLKRLRGFLAIYRPEITSFREMTKETLVEYLKYVLVSTHPQKGTLLSPGTIITDVLALKFLLIRGAFHGWDVPENTYDVEEVYQQWIFQNERIKRYSNPRNRKRFLPDKELVHKIIECAIKDPDILASTSIIVASQLGL
ncbi:hypothetical protein [Aneurinibacillus migulanus]|uniref:hypothetical protein n=1 Tax=Aneurinibacillus migulanus TaxID=47500 RepID=UPI0005BAD21B|nr:hypothetical protein [Aneurinibacillus migulanus]